MGCVMAFLVSTWFRATVQKIEMQEIVRYRKRLWTTSNQPVSVFWCSIEATYLPHSGENGSVLGFNSICSWPASCEICEWSPSMVLSLVPQWWELSCWEVSRPLPLLSLPSAPMVIIHTHRKPGLFTCMLLWRYRLNIHLHYTPHIKVPTKVPQASNWTWQWQPQ